MSKHAKVKQWFTALGEFPAADVKGLSAQAAELRKNPRLRSPFGFCSSKLSKGKLPHA